MNEIKFDIIVGIRAEGASIVVNMNTSALKAYFSEKYLWFYYRRALLPNVAYLIQDKQEINVRVIGYALKYKLKTIERIIREDIEKAGLKIKNIIFDSPEKYPEKDSILFSKNYHSVLSFLASEIEIKEPIKPFDIFRQTGAVVRFGLGYEVDMQRVKDEMWFGSSGDRQRLEEEWSKISEKFKNEKSVLIKAQEVFEKLHSWEDKNFWAMVWSIEKKIKENKNIQIDKCEYFILLVRSAIDILVRLHPLVTYKLDGHFSTIPLIALDLVKTGRRSEIMELASIINWVTNSCVCGSPRSCEGYEKEVLMEYSFLDSFSNEKVKDALYNTYKRFGVLDIWAVIGNEGMFSKIVESLAKQIIEKYPKEETIRLITDDHLEDIVLMEKLGKQISKNKKCIIEKNFSEGGIILYICANSTTIAFSKLRPILDRIDGFVSIIKNNWWVFFKPNNLPQDSIYYLIPGKT